MGVTLSTESSPEDEILSSTWSRDKSRSENSDDDCSSLLSCLFWFLALSLLPSMSFPGATLSTESSPKDKISSSTWTQGDKSRSKKSDDDSSSLSSYLIWFLTLIWVPRTISNIIINAHKTSAAAEATLRYTVPSFSRPHSPFFCSPFPDIPHVCPII